jgi:hypothetical protein
MQVTYQLTPADIRDGLTSYRTRTFTHWLLHRAGSAFAVLIVVYVGWLYLTQPESDLFLNLRPLGILCVFVLALTYLLPYMSAGNILRNIPTAQGTVNLQISESSLHLQTPKSDATLLFTALVRYVEGKTTFSLYTTPRIFITVPKRAFTPEQLAEFRQLLEQKIKLA